MMKTFGLIALLALVTACTGAGENRKGHAKNEILAAEKEFQQMVRDKGMKEAFLYFADDNATIVRGERLFEGKEAIRAYYGRPQRAKMELFWTPKFVDASTSGDLGYTYGTYTFIVTDSTGARKEGKGFFHTVWKKQADGKWKFVWD